MSKYDQIDKSMRYKKEYIEGKEKYYRAYAEHSFYLAGYIKIDEDMIDDFLFEKDFVIDEVHLAGKFRDEDFFRKYIEEELERRINKYKIGICSVCGSYCKGSRTESSIDGHHFGRTEYNWKNKICTKCNIKRMGWNKRC